MPIASTIAEQRQRVDRVAEQLQMPANAPISDTGTASERDQRCAPALQEQVDDQEHEQHRLAERLQHLRIDTSTKRVVSYGTE